MRDESQSWQHILATGFSTAADLLDFLELPVDLGSVKAELRFPTRVPRGFAQRMQKQNPRDPLLLQVLSQSEELSLMTGFSEDPLAEKQSNPITGLIHKYHGRVLLTVIGACAVHCRYCFRRHFPYAQNNPGREGWLSVIEYIRQDLSIHEVILSGGDPLLANDKTLHFLINALETIPHVTTLRIHTRIPVVLPERITHSLCEFLKNSRLKIVIVLHVNHPQELSDEVKNVCDMFRAYGFYLLNQSVLLRGINDDCEVLVSLSERLFSYGILPYYLHLLDKVQGASHYDLPREQAKALHQALSKYLPGYLVPRLVQEVPNAPHKVWI
jgi:L-lysine 2,3-aminomutase